MSKREIFFGGGRPYRHCEIVFAETNESGTIVGPYMIAREDNGAEHVVRQGYGTWCAISPIDLVYELQERDRLREMVAIDQRLDATRVRMTNELEAERMERELAALSNRASQLSSRTSRLTRHRWNRIWSNINSAIVGCREILGATAESK